MSAKERAALITKLYKACKKQYPVVLPSSSRSVLEQVIYACCLEDSSFESADESFAKLQSEYIDWNEVRVTTQNELAEVCKSTMFPAEAAKRIKKTLHGIFETYYSFEIDYLKKENIGKSLTQFAKYKGTSPFVIAYMAQNGLGGHSIPIDKSFMNVMYAIGAVSEKELGEHKVPGLERTIPKNKGVEFFSVVHQLAVAFTKSPFNKQTREFLLKISPSAKERFPKRGGKKKAVPAPVEEPVKEEPVQKAVAKKAAAKASKKTTKKAPAKKKAAVKAKATKSKSKAAKKKVSKKKASAKPAKKKTAKKSKKAATKKTSKRKPVKKKKSPTKRLKRKKPR